MQASSIFCSLSAGSLLGVATIAMAASGVQSTDSTPKRPVAQERSSASGDTITQQFESSHASFRRDVVSHLRDGSRKLDANIQAEDAIFTSLEKVLICGAPGSSSMILGAGAPRNDEPARGPQEGNPSDVDQDRKAESPTRATTGEQVVGIVAITATEPAASTRPAQAPKDEKDMGGMGSIDRGGKLSPLPSGIFKLCVDETANKVTLKNESGTVVSSIPLLALSNDDTSIRELPRPDSRQPGSNQSSTGQPSQPGTIPSSQDRPEGSAREGSYSRTGSMDHGDEAWSRAYMSLVMAACQH